MAGTETAHQVGHQPGPERSLELQRDQTGLGFHQLLHRRQSVVEVVDHSIDMMLEGCPGMRQAQRPTMTAQQWRAHLVF